MGSSSYKEQWPDNHLLGDLDDVCLPLLPGVYCNVVYIVVHTFLAKRWETGVVDTSTNDSFSRVISLIGLRCVKTQEAIL